MKQKHIIFKKKFKTIVKKEGFFKYLANMLYVQNLQLGGTDYE